MRLAAIRLFAVFLLAGCATGDLDVFAREHTTAEERAFALSYLQLLAAGRIDSAATLLAPNLRSDTATLTLGQVGRVLRDARLDSLHLIGVNISDNAGTEDHDLNLTYEAPTSTGRWLTTNVATRSAQGHSSVIGVSAHRIPGRLEEINAFTLADRSPLHYVWLVLAGLMPLITLAAAVRVIAAKGMPRRWFWAVVALIASPAFVLNWTTGQVAIANNLFVLFGAAFDRPGVAAPWAVTFAVPIGATVAYVRLRAWQRVRRASEAARSGQRQGRGRRSVTGSQQGSRLPGAERGLK